MQDWVTVWTFAETSPPGYHLHTPWLIKIPGQGSCHYLIWNSQIRAAERRLAVSRLPRPRPGWNAGPSEAPHSPWQDPEGTREINWVCIGCGPSLDTTNTASLEAWKRYVLQIAERKGLGNDKFHFAKYPFHDIYFILFEEFSMRCKIFGGHKLLLCDAAGRRGGGEILFQRALGSDWLSEFVEDYG